MKFRPRPAQTACVLERAHELPTSVFEARKDRDCPNRKVLRSTTTTRTVRRAVTALMLRHTQMTRYVNALSQHDNSALINAQQVPS
jgi:hypothetical protein